MAGNVGRMLPHYMGQPMVSRMLLQTSRPIFSSHLSTPCLISLHGRAFASLSPDNANQLSWNEFLRLRRQRRASGVIASIPCAIGGLYGGLWYFGRGEIDPTQTIFGFDPLIMNVVFVAGCGLLGWLIGPTVGRGLWHLLHRKKTLLIGQVYCYSAEIF